MCINSWKCFSVSDAVAATAYFVRQRQLNQIYLETWKDAYFILVVFFNSLSLSHFLFSMMSERKIVAKSK